MHIEELVSKYQRLTDLKDKRETEIKKINEVADKIKAKLLEYFNENGIDSVKTPLGTVYKTVRTSTTVADWDVFLNHVKKHDLWNMLEHRCSSKAAGEYMAAHDDPPPGVNLSRYASVSIRRS